MMKAKLGIYIHIPFCWKKCNYCDFISFSKMELADQYLIALINEIKASKYKDYIIDTYISEVELLLPYLQSMLEKSSLLYRNPLI